MKYFHSEKLAVCDAGAVDQGSIDTINRVCGPLRALTADDVHVRGLIILGEEPTTKGSIHPKESLEALAALLPKAPMMVGHVWDAAPWGKVFEASVVDNEAGYKGSVLKLRYFFLKDAEGDKRAQQIDSGIFAEGSIAYFFGGAKCSICGMSLGDCKHKPLEEYDGVTCYWVPCEFTKVAEVSFPVFRGAYEKTQATLNSDEEKGASAALDNLIKGVNDDGHAAGDSSVGKLSGDAGTDSGAGEVVIPAGGQSDVPPAGNGATPDAGDQGSSGSANAGDNGSASGSSDGSAPDAAVGAAATEVPVVPPAAAPAPVEVPTPASPASDAADAAAGAVAEGAIAGVGATIPVAPEAVPVEIHLGMFLGSSATIDGYFHLDAFKALPVGAYTVQPKYDGVYAEIHIDADGKVFALVGGADLTARFPLIASAAQKLPKSTVLCGMIVKYRGRQRLDRSDVAAYSSGTGAPDDFHFKFKLFDAPMVAGQDQRSSAITDRLKAIGDLSQGGTIQAVKTVLVEHESDSLDIGNVIASVSTRDGATVLSGGKRFDYRRQFVINARVKAVEETASGCVYTCEVVNEATGEAVQIHGETPSSSIKASVGAILEVALERASADKDTGNVSWHAPKVLSVRNDVIEPESASVLWRIAAARDCASSSTNVIQLGDVVPRLKRLPHAYRLCLVGGLVEHGSSLHDIDLVVSRELSDEEHVALGAALGEEYAEFIDLSVSPVGPSGPALELTPDMTPAAVEALSKKGKFADQFVVNKHLVGDKAHYDIRFGLADADRLWGWTLFSEMKPDGTKTRSVEKQQHDSKWLTYEGEIPAGQPGNPSKNLMSKMEIVDSGTYELVKRTKDFLEVILHGKNYSGRYVWRKISVQNVEDDMLSLPAHEGGSKSKYIWICWKPKDQTILSATNEIGYKIHAGTLLIWETTRADSASLVPEGLSDRYAK